MIYINNETTTVKVPKFNREYEQNKIVATNQVTGVEWQFRLTDISTNADYYEYNKPSFNCNDYVGSYDYQIMYNDIVLSSGIVVIEGDSNVVDNIEYQPEEDYVIEYTPTNSGVVVPERSLIINENGIYEVKGYDKADVLVEIGTNCEEAIAELEGTIDNLESTIADLQEKVNSVTSITINEEGTYVAPEGVLGWNEVIVNMQEPVEELPKYLWIKPLTGDIYFEYTTDGTLSPNFEYSYNTTDWNVWDYSALRIKENQKLYLRGVNNRQISNYQDNLHRNCFAAEGMGCDQVAIGGNLMALVDGEGTTKVIPADSMFNSLFREFYSNLVYIPGSGGEYGVGESDLFLNELILPATTLTTGCYQSMFLNTKVLTYPKKLPATELKPYCYSQMFYTNDWVGVNVIRELDAPTLFGKTLENRCYEQMFYGCNNISNIICLAERHNYANHPFYMIFYDSGGDKYNVNFICNIALQYWDDDYLPTYKTVANYDPNVYMSYLPTNLLNSLVK